jgi:single-stranded-DNA-specific exonuclease
MTIDTVADRLARRLLEADFVEVLSHNDADGIASAAIVALALHRQSIPFRLRTCDRLRPEIIPSGEHVLLCDLQPTDAGVPADVMVIDHHVTKGDVPCQVNPRLAGIDGDRELSSAGAAFLVASHMGDNRDLAGLAIIGMIGDGQTSSGTNREIISDAIANGFIEAERGLCLAGRDRAEELLIAIRPHLAGISGDEAAVAALMAKTGDGKESDALLNEIVMQVAPTASSGAMEAVYGDIYELEREVVHDAHTMAAMVEACGKSGAGGIAASLCLRSSDAVGEAWEITRRYHLAVIAAVRQAKPLDQAGTVYEVGNPAIAGSVADILAHDTPRTSPLAVIAREGEVLSVSVRASFTGGADMAALVSGLADEFGGHGGGHHTRAGATIPAAAAEQFAKRLSEVLCA